MSNRALQQRAAFHSILQFSPRQSILRKRLARPILRREVAISAGLSMRSSTWGAFATMAVTVAGGYFHLENLEAGRI
jgi:hypothetical protein